MKDKKTLNGVTIRVRCEDERIFQRLFYRLWNSRTLHTSMLFVCCPRSGRGDCEKTSNLASHAYILCPSRKSNAIQKSLYSTRCFHRHPQVGTLAVLIPLPPIVFH